MVLYLKFQKYWDFDFKLLICITTFTTADIRVYSYWGQGKSLLPLAKILTYPLSPKFCFFPNKCLPPLTLEPPLTNLWVLPPISCFVYYDKLVFSRQVEGKNNRKLLTLSIYQPIVTITEWLNPVKVQTNPKTGIFMN